MDKTNIAIDSPARIALRNALLAMLGEETERLDGALMQADREQHPQEVRDAYRRVQRLGGVIEDVGWEAAPERDRILIDVSQQLPLALAALQRELACLQEIADDSREHGDAEQTHRSDARLQQTQDALRILQAHDVRDRGEADQADRDDAA